jgi:glucosamine 6-phosphate synthetase-like amidotransferase/phosphosugar isomerase protein
MKKSEMDYFTRPFLAIVPLRVIASSMLVIYGSSVDQPIHLLKLVTIE